MKTLLNAACTVSKCVFESDAIYCGVDKPGVIVGEDPKRFQVKLEDGTLHWYPHNKVQITS